MSKINGRPLDIEKKKLIYELVHDKNKTYEEVKSLLGLKAKSTISQHYNEYLKILKRRSGKLSTA